MHRDLKPDNIMLTDEMNVKLIDFGLCKRDNEGKTMCGTYGFMAPEILFNKKRIYGRQVDVWSIGCIIYTTIFGYCPFLLNPH